MSTTPFLTDRRGEGVPVINHGQLGHEIVAQRMRVLLARQQLEREEAQLAVLLDQADTLAKHREARGG